MQACRPEVQTPMPQGASPGRRDDGARGGRRHPARHRGGRAGAPLRHRFWHFNSTGKPQLMDFLAEARALTPKSTQVAAIGFAEHKQLRAGGAFPRFVEQVQRRGWNASGAAATPGQHGGASGGTLIASPRGLLALCGAAAWSAERPASGSATWRPSGQSSYVPVATFSTASVSNFISKIAKPN